MVFLGASLNTGEFKVLFFSVVVGGHICVAESQVQ